MRTYIFIEDESEKRGYNVSIRVYRIVNNKPVWIGSDVFQTAAWRGAKGSANNIIAAEEGYKSDGYNILRKDVQVIQV